MMAKDRGNKPMEKFNSALLAGTGGLAATNYTLSRRARGQDQKALKVFKQRAGEARVSKPTLVVTERKSPTTAMSVVNEFKNSVRKRKGTLPDPWD
jgi:hypothetical protein